MSDIITWLAGWYNWPFLFPMAIGLLFIAADLLLGSVSDMLGFDADGDVDVDGDFDGSVFHTGIIWLGIGKVPISVLLELLLISFGAVGLLIIAIGTDLTGHPEYAFPVAIFGAAFCAPLITKAGGSLFASIVPPDSTTSKKPSDFVGEVGVTASTVSHSIGQVRLDAADGRPSTVLTARLLAGDPGPLPRGVSVLIVSHISEKNLYIVTPTGA